ncbi:MAG: TIGR01212 family radical SAM protein [Halanaerobiales bacterium]
MTLYYKYSEYLKDKYGEKTYKLPINLPVTCPNRDGVVGTGGCAFCGEEATGFENLSNKYSVKEQLIKNREYIGEKYGADLFIAYFQNFTNTYMPLDDLKEYVQESLKVEGVVEISLSTRPDCISEEYIKQINALIFQAEKDINLSLELGLQTVNYHTLEELNRGHTLAEFIDAIMIARKYSVDVGVHLIPNLPGDNMLDVKENARILSALGISNVKLHALYIREDTELGELYKEGALSMISLEEYIDRVITFLEYLDPDIAVQRLLGRAPEENTLFVNWDHSWWKIQDMILKEMKARNSYQGKKFSYLNGKALKKFEN